MSDQSAELVERLREASGNRGSLVDEAADRIEHLERCRGELAEALRKTLDGLRALREELPMKDTRENHALILDVGLFARHALERSAPLPGKEAR